jgi:hypothetical protein
MIPGTLFFGRTSLKVAASDESVSDPASVQYRLDPDGFAYKGPSLVVLERWLIAGRADQVEVFASPSGSTPTGSALSTWLSLATAQSWGLSTTGANKVCDLALQFRKAGTTTPILDTATITLEVGTA